MTFDYDRSVKQETQTSMASDFPRTRKTRRSKRTSDAFLHVAICLFGSGLLFWSLSSALDSMTRNDCKAGIQKACEATK